jgi:hypothetical protein
MPTILQKKILTWWYIGVLTLLIFVPLFWTSPDIWEDTRGYLNFDSMRPPLYPIFLYLFHGLGKHQLVAAMWVQSILNFLVLLYTSHWLYKRLELPRYFIVLIMLISITIFFLHFGMLINILSEAIAFPLFVLTFILFVESFKDFDIKKIFFLTLASNLLILTREQFYCFYPLFVVLIVWHLWKYAPIRKVLVGSAIILLSILATAFLNRAYNHSVHHAFRNSAGVGELFITQGLYLSNADMNKYFDNLFEKTVFEKIMQQLEEKQLTRQTAPLALRPPLTLEIARTHYDLAHDHILEITKSSLPSVTTDYEARTIFIKMSKTLYSHAIKENIIFYLLRVAYFVGGIWIFFGIFIFLLAISLRSLIDREWSPAINQVFIAVSFFMILANATFVPIFAHFEIRYCYYSYFLYFILFGILGKELFAKVTSINIIDQPQINIANDVYLYKID